MTEYNDFQLNINYFGMNTYQFMPLPVFNIPTFNTFCLPFDCWKPNFKFNLDFSLPFFTNSSQTLPEKTTSSQNIFNNNPSVSTNNFLDTNTVFNTNITFNTNTSFNTGMLDTFTPSKKSFTDTAAKTKKLAEKKPEVKMSVGKYKPFKISEYNASKGEKLAQLSKEYTHYGVIKNGNERKIDKSKRKASEGKNAWTHRCATYVGLAIRDCGLGDYPYADGCQMAAKLRQNSNFKEIPVSGTDWKNLPAGCVLCYNAGSQGYNKVAGHTEITQPNGTATSDGTTHNIRKPDAIFIPV